MSAQSPDPAQPDEEPLPTRQHAPVVQPVPVAQLVLIGLTVLGTLAYHSFWPGLYHLVRRDPDALKHGQIWRVISPILVQPDRFGITLTVFVLVTVAGVFAERHFGTRTFLVLYLGGALVAHVVGEWWQPYSSGVSVAGCGVVGGMAVWWLRMRAPGPLSAGIGTIAIGFLLFSGQDIHGAALLYGVVAGAVLLRSVPATYLGRVRSPGR